MFTTPLLTANSGWSCTCVAGSLPASLPEDFRKPTVANSLAVLYLSNNSITGSLPSTWGDVKLGWGESLQRLYLSDNQLTGQLPQLWSDSDSMFELGRVDLFGNQLTGSVPWRHSTVPSLRNLVLLPGRLLWMHGRALRSPDSFVGSLLCNSTMSNVIALICIAMHHCHVCDNCYR